MVISEPYSVLKEDGRELWAAERMEGDKRLPDSVLR